MQKFFFGLSGFFAGASLAVATAQAADNACGKWETSFGSLAGEGEALNTSFCSEPEGQEYSFEITCGGGSMNLRFMPQIEGSGLTFNKETVEYAIDGKSFAVATQYEELDGAFAADVDTTDPLGRGDEGRAKRRGDAEGHQGAGLYSAARRVHARHLQAHPQLQMRARVAGKAWSC